MLFEHLTRILKIDPPAVGEVDAALIAVEEPHAEFVLERSDLLAQRGLSDPERLSRPMKIQVRGERGERRELTEIRYDTSPMSSCAVTAFSISP
jgi:hypothetical protein